jgi:diguanylate cyclase (GGDEF)-like protein
MSDLIDRLARLTCLRDVDALDVALCGLAHDVLACQQVSIHRLLGDHRGRSWMTTACAGTGPDALLLASERQPPGLDDRPHWRDAATGDQPLHCPGALHSTLHSMSDDADALAVLAVHSAVPPSPKVLRLTASLLGFYRQLRGLMHENERDSLTGLLNRKTFDEAFVRAAMDMDGPSGEGAQGQDEERRDAPGAARHWLAVVDIDHFKRVNDLHGHLIGDEVLLLVAQLMRHSFRHGDRIYRFGGEEFVVMLRCPDGEAAEGAFERLRQRIEKHDFPRVGQLTVSIGFTGVTPDDTPGAAFERADQAVYHAKQTGRNRTVAHACLAASEAPEAAPLGELEFF